MTKSFSTSPAEKPRKWTILSWLLVLFVLMVTLLVCKPAMPHQVILLSGPPTSAYHDLAERLAEGLRQRGLDVEVTVTDGAMDNLRRLDERENVVAFAPAIVDWDRISAEKSGLVALGSVSVEPIWLFYRSGLEVNQLSDLEGRTVLTAGTNATGHQVAGALIDQIGYSGRIELTPVPERTVARSLAGFADGSVDALFISGQPRSREVAKLLHAADIGLMSFRRAKAYAKRVSGAMVIVAPEGVFDMARNMPAQDTTLLACATCMVAEKGIHPALVPILLSSVESIHREDSSFITTIRFPSTEHLTLPVAPAATRYFRMGEVGLSSVLPYQLVRFLNHLGFFVLPLVTAVVVLVKAIPSVMRAVGNFRINRWMSRLQAVEKGHAGGVDSATLLTELQEIDEGTANMTVPKSLVGAYIDCRQVLHDMRDRVRG